MLIPQELSLVITSPSDDKQDRRKFPADNNICVSVWTNSTIPRGTYIYPFQGTIRLDKLDIYNYLDYSDVSVIGYYYCTCWCRRFRGYPLARAWIEAFAIREINRVKLESRVTLIIYTYRVYYSAHTGLLVFKSIKSAKLYSRV